MQAGRFHYQGTMKTNQLPWEIRLEYFLNGQPVLPDALSGAQGRLEIGLDVQPVDEMRVYADSLTLQISLTLSGEKCLNIQAERGTQAIGGGDRAISFVILPGQGAEYHITADVRDFSMPGIQAAGIRMTMDEQMYGSAARSALAGTLKAEFGRALFSANRAHLLPGAALSALTLAAMILAAPSPADAAGIMIFCTLALGTLAFFGTRGLERWKTAFRQRDGGGRSMAPAVSGAILLAAVAGMAAFVGKAALEVVPPTAFVLLVLVVLVNALFLHLMAAPTVAGRQIMDGIEGFRMHLSEAGEPRPDDLPYALALDLEDAWSERFAAALDAATPGPEAHHPAWYSARCGEPSGRNSFSAAMGGGLTGAVSASANAPGSTDCLLSTSDAADE